MTRWTFRVSCVIWLCIGCAFVRAQDEDPKPSELPKLPEILKEGTVPLQARVYLPDGKGEPRFVPNIRFAEFLEIMSAQASRAEGTALPNTIFDSVECKLKVNGRICEVAARVKIAVSPDAAPVSVIDLGLGNVRLSKAPAFEGEGTSLWQVSTKQPGYTWWLKSAPATTHTALLDGQMLLSTEGDREALELFLPAAPTNIALEIPKNASDIRLKAQSGEIFQRVIGSESDVVQIRSGGGSLALSWQIAAEGKRTVGATEIKTRTVLQVDDPRSNWEAESKITVRQFGDAPSDVFTVVLPPGSVWLPVPLSLTQQYSVTLENPSGTAEGLPTPNVTPQALPGSNEKLNTPEPARAESPKSESSNAGVSQNGESKNDGPKNESQSPSAVVPASGSVVVPNPRPSVRLRVRLLSRSPATSNEPIVIRWQWSPERNKDAAAIETSLPQLVVEGADRHELTTELDLPSQYSLDWKGDAGVELLQHSRLPDSQERQSFLFRAQRERLLLRVALRRGSMVPDIRPTYLAEIDRSRIKLRGWYECEFDRGDQPELRLNHEGWILETAELVSDATAPYSEGDYLSRRPEGESILTLSSESLDAESTTSPNRNRQLWRVVFYRSLTQVTADAAVDAKFDLDLKLPRILRPGSENAQQTDEGSGVLLVSQANNVSLRWNESSTRGLISDTVSTQLTPFLSKTPVDRVLCFRFQNKVDTPAVWVGRMEVLPRVVSSESMAAINVREGGVNVSQTIQFQIANEALPELRVRIPESVINAQNVSVFVDGTPCTLQRRVALSTQTATPPAPAPDTQPAGGVQENIAEFNIVGVSNLIGKVVAEFRSFVPLTESVKPNEAIGLAVPLITSAGNLSGSTSQRILIHVERPLTAAIPRSDSADLQDDAQWRSVDADPLDIRPDQTQLSLRLRKLAVLSRTPVRVSRAWQQTVMNGQERVDRFAARIETNTKRLTFTLPHGSRSPEVALDGFAVQPIADVEQGRFQVDLPASSNGVYTLEIWTSLYSAPGWFESVKLEPVEIEGCSGFDRLFWQLVLPSKHHLALAPDDMSPDWKWEHNGVYWRRVSSVGQEDLEQWVGASAQPPLPRSANTYVLSTYGIPQEQQAWITTRLLFWLPVGLLAVVLSLSLALWRPLRHPAFLILLATGLFALSLVWPDMAVMALQTLVPAVSIVLLFALTQAAVESRVRRRSIFTTRPTSGTFEGSDHGSLVRPTSSPSGSGLAPNSARAQAPLMPGGGS